MTICGDVSNEAVVYTEDQLVNAPTLCLYGKNNLSIAENYYTIILSNPDDMIPVGPIIHNMIGNIKGSDLMQCKTTGTTVFEYFSPNPPIPFKNFHYVYLVYLQGNSNEDFSDVMEMDTTKFDVDAVAESHNLFFLTSNYFVAEW